MVGTKIFLQAPESFKDDTLKQIPKLIDNRNELGFFTQIFENYKSANLIFEIPSDYTRSNVEILLISGIVDIKSDFNLNLLKEFLEGFVEEINNIEEAYKGFYLDSNKYKGDSKILNDVKNLFHSFYKSVQPAVKALMTTELHYQSLLNKLEGRVKASEQKYRDLWENSPESIVLINKEGIIKDCNSKTEEIFGLKKTELTGKKFINLGIFSKKQITLFKKAYKDFFKGKKSKPMELQLKKEDNALVWIYYNSSIFKIDDEVLLEARFQDITKRKEVEKELKELDELKKQFVNRTTQDLKMPLTSMYSASKMIFDTFQTAPDINKLFIPKKTLEFIFQDISEKYRIISEDAEDLIVIFNDNLDVEYINETAHLRVLGYTFKEYKDSSFRLSIVHEDDLKGMLKSIRMAFKTGSYTNQLRLKPKEGDYKWFEAKGKTFFGSKGRKKLMYISRDITQIKEAEARIKESEKKYRDLWENSPESILLVNKEGTIRDCNSATERIFGFKKTDLIGKNYIDLGVFTKNQVSLLIKEKKPKLLELQIKKKDGGTVWINYQSSMVKVENEFLIQALIQDITEKKEAEKVLKELDELRKEFIIRATHELKTPLTSMYGASQMIYDMFQSIPDEYKFLFPQNFSKYINYIFTSTSRLKELALNLLDFSQLESGTFQLNKEKINISELIRDCVQALKFQTKKRKIKIFHNLPHELYLNTDKFRITQVFNNLISNALKNTPVDGKIFINFEKNKEKIRFFVKDTGIGLTSNEIDKLFTKFGKIIRKEANISTEGFGCGLYITKQIIKSHNGKIWAESQGRNKGATFIIEIPG